MIFSWRGKFYGHAMPFVLCGEGEDQSDYGCKDFYNSMGVWQILHGVVGVVMWSINLN